MSCAVAYVQDEDGFLSLKPKEIDLVVAVDGHSHGETVHLVYNHSLRGEKEGGAVVSQLADEADGSLRIVRSDVVAYRLKVVLGQF